jgi:hypothetical protein
VLIFSYAGTCVAFVLVAERLEYELPGKGRCGWTSRGVLLIRGRFTVADLAGLPLPGGCMDLIVSTASLRHWTDAGTMIAS